MRLFEDAFVAPQKADLTPFQVFPLPANLDASLEATCLYARMLRQTDRSTCSRTELRDFLRQEPKFGKNEMYAFNILPIAASIPGFVRHRTSFDRTDSASYGHITAAGFAALQQLVPVFRASNEVFAEELEKDLQFLSLYPASASLAATSTEEQQKLLERAATRFNFRLLHWMLTELGRSKSDSDLQETTNFLQQTFYRAYYSADLSAPKTCQEVLRFALLIFGEDFSALSTMPKSSALKSATLQRILRVSIHQEVLRLSSLLDQLGKIDDNDFCLSVIGSPTCRQAAKAGLLQTPTELEVLLRKTATISRETRL